MSRANDQISLQILDQSCLPLAAREGPLGQDTEYDTDIALSCHHQVHWWIMWIFMVTRQWQFIIVSSVQLWRVCTLQWLEESAAGQDQIGILARGDTNSDQATLHQHYQVHQIRSYDWLTVDGVRRIPMQDICHVGVQPAHRDLSTMSVSTLLDLLELNNSLVYKTQPVCLMQS